MTQVYANILESLTSGLYNEINFAVREYLQNAYDAIKTARQQKIPEPEEGFFINVQITKDNQIVTITDNGIGMEESILREYTSIGGGTKNNPDLTGHKGIGKLSGLRFFENFTVKTKSYNSAVVHELVWNSGGMMRALFGDQEKIKKIPYIEFIKDYIAFSTFDCPGNEKEHYTHIQLIDVLDEFKSQLNEEKIGSFIKTSFPVPFYEEGFKLSKDINEFMGDTLVPVQTFINDKVIYQSHRDEDNLVTPLFYTIKYDDKIRAKAWISWIKSTSETISKSEIKGIRFRCKGICVGDNNLFANNCMPPGRDHLSNWFTGEVVVIDDDIRPSAARDRFYEGEESRRFFKEIKTKIGKDLSLLADIRSEISAAEQELSKWQKGQVKSKASFNTEIEKRIRELEKHKKRNIYPFNFSIIEKLSNLLADEEKKEIKKYPKEDPALDKLIKNGNKNELVQKMLKYKTDEINASSKKAKKVIKDNIKKISNAIVAETNNNETNSDSKNTAELEKILRIFKRYLEINSIEYDESKLKNFIAKELSN